jgi:predicted DNA-binding protein YlxM (UPF0122 family)
MGRPKGSTNLEVITGGASLQEIANELGVTREAIRQTENRALKKLHRWCQENPVAAELMLECLREGLAQKSDSHQILR